MHTCIYEQQRQLKKKAKVGENSLKKTFYNYVSSKQEQVFGSHNTKLDKVMNRMKFKVK